MVFSANKLKKIIQTPLSRTESRNLGAVYPKALWFVFVPHVSELLTRLNHADVGSIVRQAP